MGSLGVAVSSYTRGGVEGSGDIKEKLTTIYFNIQLYCSYLTGKEHSWMQLFYNCPSCPLFPGIILTLMLTSKPDQMQGISNSNTTFKWYLYNFTFIFYTSDTRVFLNHAEKSIF